MKLKLPGKNLNQEWEVTFKRAEYRAMVVEAVYMVRAKTMRDANAIGWRRFNTDHLGYDRGLWVETTRIVPEH
jgi:hypothetical protein